MKGAVLALVAASLGLAAAPAPSGAVPSAPAKPAIRALVYRGLDRDVVGRLNVARPNGERDGHFTVTLVNAKRVVLSDVVLQRVFATGPGYAEGWDTNPGTSASVLGVTLDGKRLNPTDRTLAVAVAPGTHRLELYANDHYGVFAPGQYFRATALFPDGVTAASPRLRLPGSAPTLTVQFAGLGSDVVGRNTDQKPNGEPDAHFVVRLDTHGSWQTITNVAVRRLNSEGALDLPLWWMQGPQTAGLLVGGQRVMWPTEMPWWGSVYVTVDPKASPVKLDVYANDPSPKDQPSSYFGPGQQYRLSVTFTDSQLLGGETHTDLRL